MKTGKSFKSRLNLSRREQRGMIILLVLAGVFIFINIILTQIPNKPPDVFVEPISGEAPSNENYDPHQQRKTGNEKYSIKTITFDPNTATEDIFIQIGLKPYVINNILKYRAKGGVFKTPDDFGKLYGLDPDIFEMLKPYIEINVNESRQQTYDSIKYVKYKKAPVNISDLNSADSAELTTISGIGPSFASRIIKYRNRLGGYVSKNQLLEVYGMDSIRYYQIKDFIEIDASNIVKIDLNQISFKALMKHPYFEYHTVKAIFDYRNKHRGFDNIEELGNIPLIYPELFLKIKPYLEITSVRP